MNTITEQFKTAIEQAGLCPPRVIYDDGKLHRFSSNGQPDDDAGWYVLHSDGLPAGMFGCWRKGIKEPWCAKSDHQMTDQERRAYRQRIEKIHRDREEQDRQRHEEAAQRAVSIWGGGQPVSPNHPYLLNKQVPSYGLRLHHDGRLIIPLQDENGNLHSLELIDADGNKFFLSGGRTKGLFHLIGDASSVLCIAEGYATAASIHKATDYPVAVAFFAGNLLSVAKALRVKHPTATLAICGDHDQSGVGQAKAMEAAEAVGGVAIIPDTEGMDWNDVHVRDGLAMVKTAIDSALDEQPMMTETTASGEANLTLAMVNYRDLMGLSIPERARHLPWLPEGGNVMVFGPRGIGKTFLQLALAVSLTTGKDLLKWNVESPVGVLYLDGEMQLDELRERATALMDTPPAAPLEFLTSQLVYQRCGGKDLILTSPAMRQQVVNILDARPDIKVLILDNISCLFSGINEDSKQDWEPINAWLIRLRHRGITTVLVHHSGKGGQQRGTSGREDSLDTVVQLKEPAGKDARDGCHFEMHFTKCRSMTGDAVAPLDVRLVKNGHRFTWHYEPVEVTKYERAKQLYADGVTVNKDLAIELDCTPGYASKLIKRLKTEMGVVS